MPSTLRRKPAHKEKRVAAFLLQPVCMLAEWTGLEPATPGVTGRYSNQLNYHSMMACCTAQLVRCTSAIELGVP
jgi:hypothetical protein